MLDRTLHFVVPGDLETRTGGYGYDREILAGLRERGWIVHVVSLPGDYPFPSARDRDEGARIFADIPEGSRVLVDGLAFGALPRVAICEQDRLMLIALVHHPLGLETGLDAADASTLVASEREALTAAVGVVVTSPRTVSAGEGLGVSTDRIVVVEPGTPSVPVARGGSPGPLRMLCVASLTPRKGHDTLLDALERLSDVDWRLTIVGDCDRASEHGARVKARSAASLMQGRIAIAGELTGAALESAYDEADLFVLPTHYEGYGMVVAEALAHGIPVVSTPTGAIPELVGDAAGILVTAGDAAALAGALRSVITDLGRLSRLRQGAVARRASLRTWPVACAAMEQALMRFARA